MWRAWLGLLVAAVGCVDAASPDEPGPRPRPQVDGAAFHDEDRDGVVDGSDNCPHVDNADQADRGEADVGAPADGVGDACDPQPAIAGNAIALFVGTFAPDPQRALDGDAARLGVPGWLLLDDALIPGHAVLEAGVRLAPRDGGGGGIAMTRLDGGGGCQLAFDRLQLTAPSGDVARAAPRSPPETPMRLALRTAGGRWQCALTAAATPPLIVAASADAPDADVGQVHLYAMADHAWVDYVVVITLAP